MHAAKLAGQRRETGVCHCHQLHETDLMTHGQNASACQPGCWWAEEDQAEPHGPRQPHGAFAWQLWALLLVLPQQAGPWELKQDPLQNDGGDPHATMSACQHTDAAAAQALAVAVWLAVPS